jgi:hypothetical protein
MAKARDPRLRQCFTLVNRIRTWGPVHRLSEDHLVVGRMSRCGKNWQRNELEGFREMSANGEVLLMRVCTSVYSSDTKYCIWSVTLKTTLTVSPDLTADVWGYTTSSPLNVVSLISLLDSNNSADLDQRADCAMRHGISTHLCILLLLTERGLISRGRKAHLRRGRRIEISIYQIC